MYGVNTRLQTSLCLPAPFLHIYLPCPLECDQNHEKEAAMDFSLSCDLGRPGELSVF